MCVNCADCGGRIIIKKCALALDLYHDVLPTTLAMYMYVRISQCDHQTKSDSGLVGSACGVAGQSAGVTSNSSLARC
jgi:hypothetical protein